MSNYVPLKYLRACVLEEVHKAAMHSKGQPFNHTRSSSLCSLPKGTQAHSASLWGNFENYIWVSQILARLSSSQLESKSHEIKCVSTDVVIIRTQSYLGHKCNMDSSLNHVNETIDMEFCINLNGSIHASIVSRIKYWWPYHWGWVMLTLVLLSSNQTRTLSYQ